jgi:hypothetical protein
MKNYFVLFALLVHFGVTAQVAVDLSNYNSKSGTQVSVKNDLLQIAWPTGNSEQAKLVLNLAKDGALFQQMQLTEKGQFATIATQLDPAFILTIGKRDLVSQNGWNIFFDKTAYLPHTSYVVQLNKQRAKVVSDGTRTCITIGNVQAAHFTGNIEITVYKGSPLINVAAVMSTQVDSTAIIYDAGLVNATGWKQVTWANTENFIESAKTTANEQSRNLAVKYRTIIGESANGSLAVFPAPHQYFYPLDNAWNLQFTWYGNNYRNMINGFGIGIRQELTGDNRWVPWFNAPPGTLQRLNFFCLLSTGKDGKAMDEVKRFTHHDAYKPLPGYYTMASHFHTEHTDDVLTNKPLPEIPGFVKALRQTGVNIMHLGEFHLAGNPGDPGPRRLPEYKKMFEECKRLSGGNFLMLPGEEPNHFFGGHWMNLFPKPVYWIMNRKPEQPFVTTDPAFGKVYRVSNKEEMLLLLEAENGLAWTAHARTKGSTGFPDKYKDEKFFQSNQFLGAAWKSMPADLSQPRLGKRILDLMDDMANWGQQKYVIGEADLFKIEPEYELYAHLNINYIQLDHLPAFDEGWQPVLDAMQKGKFFVSTGEVLLPSFTVNGKSSGDTTKLDSKGNAVIEIDADWTFPLNFIEIISGDGNKVYRETKMLHHTTAFDKQHFSFTENLKNRKWVRVEAWDVAANGAFTQFVWLQ